MSESDHGENRRRGEEAKEGRETVVVSERESARDEPKEHKQHLEESNECKHPEKKKDRYSKGGRRRRGWG
eukprot:scaffold2186_cov133-Isochrysis_galbana.AAC.2